MFDSYHFVFVSMFKVIIKVYEMKFLYTAHITKSHGGLQFYSQSKHECER